MRRNLLFKIIKIILSSLFAVLTMGVLMIIGLYLYLAADFPSIDSLKDVQLQVPLRVYDKKGELLAEYGKYRRVPLLYEEMPRQVEQAFLAAEDDRFWEHPGVDYRGLLRAAIELVTTGQKSQGGSTITMQVVRNFFLSREKTYARKLNEIFLALKIEQELTKQDIFQLYLNKIYLGKRAYGVGAAAEVYYGQKLAQLDLAQTAMIAGLPKAPSRYNPIANPERAKLRRNYVLRRMRDLGFISHSEMDLEQAKPVTARLHTKSVVSGGTYIAEMVRTEMVSRYGDKAYTDGFVVYTTLDAKLQTTANNAVKHALISYDRRHGYRGVKQQIELEPEKNPFESDELQASRIGGLEKAVVTAVEEKQVSIILVSGAVGIIDWEGMQWARKYVDINTLGPELVQASDVLSVGDVIRVDFVKAVELPAAASDAESVMVSDPETLNSVAVASDSEAATETISYYALAQIPEVEGAFIALSPKDGSIVAMVGGFDFYHSKFNRIVQARRQTGSSFKPFIYSAALENGFTTASLINDAPVVFDDPSLEATWRPENYSGKFYGPTRLREALIKSRNLVSIRILRAVDVGPAIRHAQLFGFDRKRLPRDLSLALGSCTIAPIDLARGYSVFANGGYLIEPYFIDRIENLDEVVLFQSNPERVCPECEAATKAVVLQKAEAELSLPLTTEESGNSASDAVVALSVESDAETLDVAEAKESEMLDDEMNDAIDQPPVRLAQRVIPADNVYLMRSMMRDVVKRGTAVRARALGRNDIHGKTGTTNDQHDAWFNGYNDHIVATAWVGFDRHKPLGRYETGGRAALPMWLEFMQVALEGVAETKMLQPNNIVTILIDSDTGERATDQSLKTRFELFRERNIPAEKAQVNIGHGGVTPHASEEITEQLF